MSGIARLVLTYAFGTRILRSFTVVGIITVLASFGLLQFFAQGDWLLTIPFFGVAMIFLGSALMPLMFGRMARGHLIRVLPWGRLKLLLSAFVTVALVALPLPLMSLFASYKAMDFYALHGFYGNAAPHVTMSAQAIEAYRQHLFGNFYVQLSGSFLTTGWLYLALWFITSERSIAGYVKGLLVILVIMFYPMRELTDQRMTLQGSLMHIGVVWFLFGAGFLLWPRWKAFSASWRLRPLENLRASLSRQVAGREIDVMLGTSNPWLLITAQVVPIVFASTIGFYSAAVWLFYLTIFSTVAGAIACQAAERSRILWLRGKWSRRELFAQVERSFWRHNSLVMGALIALMVSIGTYAGLPVSLLAIGVPLLMLSTILSTYLGLMVTRGLRWAEGTLAVVVMLTLMAVAVLAAGANGDPQELLRVAEAEVALAFAAAIIRSVARARWEQIDWSLCRPERAPRARASA